MKNPLIKFISNNHYQFKNNRCNRTLKINDQVTFQFEGSRITKKIVKFDIDERTNDLIFIFEYEKNDERYERVNNIIY